MTTVVYLGHFFFFFALPGLGASFTGRAEGVKLPNSSSVVNYEQTTLPQPANVLVFPN